MIQYTFLKYCFRGFPHSEICGSMLICSSPQLIAAYHVLLRLLMPRHSPCALHSLTSFVQALVWFSELCKLHKKVFYWLNCIITQFLFLTVASLSSHHFSMFSFQGPIERPKSAHISHHFRDRLYQQTFSLWLFFKWWAQVDSNHRPHDYQSCALTS